MIGWRGALTALAMVLGLGSPAVLAQSQPQGSGGAMSLRLSNWLPPAHPMVTDVLVPWARDVERATAGRVRIQVMSRPMGPPPAQYDLVRSGVVDIAYAGHGFTPGRFVLPQLAELPFLSSSAEKLSVAYWRLYQSMLVDANEYEGVKLLSLFTQGPGYVFTTDRPVTTASDLAGLKLRSDNVIADAVMRRLGMVVVNSPAVKTLDVLAGGIADGVTAPMDTINAMKLNSVVRHGTVIPGGLYNSSYFIAMNWQSWNQLQTADRQIIEALSGEKLARRAGQAWDEADARSLANLRQSGTIITVPDANTLSQLQTTLAPVEQSVLDQVDAKGIDGDAALNFLRTELSNQ